MNADELYMEGLDQFADGNWVAAISLFEQSARADPNSTEALHGIARACFEARETMPELLDKAIEASLKIVEREPNDVTAYSTLSQCYVWKGDKDTAEHWGGKARIAGWKSQLKEDKKPPPNPKKKL